MNGSGFRDVALFFAAFAVAFMAAFVIGRVL